MSLVDDDCFILEDKNVDYKSISCENIPQTFVDKLIAKKHFSQFGRINKFILRPKRRKCTVDFHREDDAKKAFLNAGNFNGELFDINYTVIDKSTKNLKECLDPELQSELDAMSNTSDKKQSRKTITIESGSGGGSTNPVKLIKNSNDTLTGNPKVVPAKVPRPILKLRPPISEQHTANTSNLVHHKIDMNVKNELESILLKPATTVEEQYKILDARDKLIRLTTIRTIDIKKVVSTKGTCPDMCPEKERLLRESRNQVASFEVDRINGCGIMDYKLAVKEYSRSSADQETPLAHELRPEPVLQMTMNYLMYFIMDLCDDPEINISDWFHFLWDRTRSIRKDITQQELCSLGGVQLLEQCARFHIHCAARLIAEDPSVFDQRINTENLTKCLQTLKYLYHDLRLKNINCKKEPEFRAYIILLNLHDSNFLWEIKQLPEHIQKSIEVQSAVAFYLAMESNNYVKFFRLIGKTSYLNACLLLRYFSQVRYKALQTIVKAYNWPRQSVSLTLHYLQHLLAFESQEETIAFFNHYGLDCDTEKVVLDRNSFYLPDEPFQIQRSFKTVEAKRKVKVGESVCGEPLKEMIIFNKHEPHCSFDENGYLLPEAWTAEDQTINKKKDITPEKFKRNTFLKKEFKVPVQSRVILPKCNLNKTPIHEENYRDNSKIPPSSLSKNNFQLTNIFHKNSTLTKPNLNNDKKEYDTLDSEFKLQKDAPSIFATTTAKSKESKFIITDSKLRVPNSMDTKNSNSYKLTKQPEYEEELMPIPEKVPSSLSILKTPATIQSKTFIQQPKINANIYADKNLELDIIKERENNERKLFLKFQEEKVQVQKLEEKKQKIWNLSTEICQKICEDIELEELQEIANHQLQIYLNLIQSSELIYHELLENLLIEINSEVLIEESKLNEKKINLLRKYFTIWMSRVSKNREHRKFINEIPVWALQDTLQESAAKYAHPTQKENLKLMKRYRLGRAKNFKINNSNILQTININAIITKELEEIAEETNMYTLKHRRHFKIILSLPMDTDELFGFNSYISKFLENTLKPTNSLANKTTRGIICESYEKFSICLRKMSGIKPINEDNNLVTTEAANATGLIFFMTNDNCFHSAQKRFNYLLKLSSNEGKIPVAFIVFVPVFDEQLGHTINNVLRTDELVMNGKISCYTQFHTFDENLKESIEDALQFLARHSPVTTDNDLEMQNLLSFLQDNLLGNIWQKFNLSYLRNPSFQLYCHQPQNIVNLYNEMINIFIELVAENYHEYMEFPEELKEFVSTKRKLDIPLSLEYFPNDWKDYQNRNLKIINFFHKIKLPDVPHFSNNNLVILETEILNYAKQCIPCEKSYRLAAYNSMKLLLEHLNKPKNRMIDDVSDSLKKISWLKIIPPIALELLQYIWNIEEKNLPDEIIYKKSIYDHFCNSNWWLNNENLLKIKFRSNTESLIRAPTIHHSNDIMIHNENNWINSNCNDNFEDIYLKSISLTEKCHKHIEKLKYNFMRNNQLTKNLDETILKNTAKSNNFRKRMANDENYANPINLLVDKEPKQKKIKIVHSPNKSTTAEDINDVISNAFAIIKKYEKRIDSLKRCEDILNKI